MKMEKKISFAWAPVIGAAFPILEELIFLMRFGRFNSDAAVVDHMYFFIAGTLAAVGFIYLLRRSDSSVASRAIMIAFLVSIPFALFGMMMGGLIGSIGIFFLGVPPPIFITAVGYFIGRILSRRGKQIA